MLLLHNLLPGSYLLKALQNLRRGSKQCLRGFVGCWEAFGVGSQKV